MRLSIGALLAVSASAQGNVWVVDSSGAPGSHFSDLGEAVQAAADGDVVLVRPGPYALWGTIDGLSLTIAADGGPVDIIGALTVQNLAAGQRVSLRGLEIKFPGQVDLLNNDGVVWIEDCTIHADLYGGAGPYGAVYAFDSRLVLQNSSLIGSMQYGFHAAPPTAGLYLHDSTAAVSGTWIYGGEGLDTIFPDLAGAAAVQVSGSMLLASGSTIVGGYGGSQPGGVGVEAFGGSTVLLRDDAVQGGGGSPAGGALSADGSSTITPVAGEAHTLTSTATPRVGEALTVSATGSSGDGVLLVVSTAPALLQLGGAAMLLVSPAPPLLSVVLGTVPAGGTLQGAFAVPPLGGAQAIELFVQDVYLDAALAGVRFGPGTTPLLLDAGF